MAEKKGEKMIGSYDIKVPEDTDVTLGYDMTANKVKNFKFSGIWTWIVSKLKGESISDLNTTNKTVVGAIKEVNNPTFTAATSRTNINSGESQSIIMGKVKKWLADLGTAAFCSVVNNLTTTSEGSVLDARQGKNLSDALTKLNTLMGSTDISAIGGGTLTGAINELSSKLKITAIAPNPLDKGNGTSSYKISPKIIDQSILCVCRREVYLITLGQEAATIFNGIFLNKVFDAVSVKDASVKLAENKKDIIFTCEFYENPIFIGRF